MHLCYVDEAGDPGRIPTATADVTPLFVVVGIAIPQSELYGMTVDLLRLKQRFNPKALGRRGKRFLNWAQLEVSGAELRGRLRSGSHKRVRYTYGYLDQFLGLMERHSARVFGRIWIKCVGDAIDGRAVYTSSIQAICNDFQVLLEQENSTGMMIADSRDPSSNAIVAHSVFTQKFQMAGDKYSRMLEMPVFGHSQNHAGLQAADLICSALLFPLASAVYCAGTINNIHVHPEFAKVKARYGDRIKRLQFRYDRAGRRQGGLVVSDRLTKRPGSALFC